MGEIGTSEPVVAQQFSEVSADFLRGAQFLNGLSIRPEIRSCFPTEEAREAAFARATWEAQVELEVHSLHDARHAHLLEGDEVDSFRTRLTEAGFAFDGTKGYSRPLCDVHSLGEEQVNLQPSHLIEGHWSLTEWLDLMDDDATEFSRALRYAQDRLIWRRQGSALSPEEDLETRKILRTVALATNSPAPLFPPLTEWTKDLLIAALDLLGQYARYHARRFDLRQPRGRPSVFGPRGTPARQRRHQAVAEALHDLMLMHGLLCTLRQMWESAPDRKAGAEGRMLQVVKATDRLWEQHLFGRPASRVLRPIWHASCERLRQWLAGDVEKPPATHTDANFRRFMARHLRAVLKASPTFRRSPVPPTATILRELPVDAFRPRVLVALQNLIPSIAGFGRVLPPTRTA